MNTGKKRWLAGLVLAAPIMLFLGGCADSSGGSASTETAPPENSADHYTINWVNDLGKSSRYNSSNGDIGIGNCLEPVNDDTGWQPDAGVLKQTASFQLLKDKKSIYDLTNASYASSMNAELYNQSSEYKMTNELQMDSNSIWALLSIEIQGPTVKRSSAKMNSQYYNRTAPLDTEQFRNACGDMAIYRIHTGAKFYGLLKITMNNLSEKNQAEASMRSATGAGGVSFKTKADFANKFSLNEESFAVTSYIYTSGGLYDKVVESVEDLTSAGDQWVNDMYTIFQGSPQSVVDLWSSPDGRKTDMNKLNYLLSNNAVSADFIAYDLDADWGTTPTKPELMSGRALMGDMGRAYVSTQVALDNFSAVLDSPEMYVISHNPLVLFGSSSASSFPMLQPHPTSTGYTVAPNTNAEVNLIRDTRDKLQNSKDMILEAAKICTDQSQAIEDQASLCDKACTITNYTENAPYALSVEDCKTQCKGKKRCDITYAYFFNDPSTGILEIEKGLTGLPLGLPASVSFRDVQSNDWTTVPLPERRYYVPMNCKDYKNEVGGATLPNAEYLFYYAGNPDQPIYLYCSSMNTSTPTTWLSLPNSTPLDSTNIPEPNHQFLDGYSNYAGERSAAGGWVAAHHSKYKVFQSEGRLWVADSTAYSTNSDWSHRYLHAASHDDLWSSMDIDVRKTPLEISHDQLFMGGGWVGTDPEYRWLTTKILLNDKSTSQVAKHNNTVVQRLKAAVAGSDGHLFALMPTDINSILYGNDGQHYLYPSYGHGPISLSYIGKENQRTVIVNIQYSGTVLSYGDVANKDTSVGAADKVVSFDTATLP